MRILLTTDVIHAGGTETFVLRLAQALVKRGHTVLLYVLYKDRVDERLVTTIAPDITILKGRLPFTRGLQKMDGLLLRLKIDFSLVNSLLARDMRHVLQRMQVDVIHSHLFTTDRIAIAAAEGLPVPVLSTMHGDYTLLWTRMRQKLPMRILNYANRMKAVLRHLSAVVCISEEQVRFFDAFKKEVLLPRVQKIYNGYELARQTTPFTRADLSIPEDGFVFGMVARGIPEKGWEPVLEAFARLKDPGCFLILVGDSPYVQELKTRYASLPSIRFAGYSKNPVDYIRLFNAGLFASTYGAESLPTVLMEYLACSVPVISTDIAESKAMLQAQGESAGLVIPLKDGKVDETELVKSMQLLKQDAVLYKRLQSACAAAFAQFDMEQCVNQYLKLYKEVCR